ncbi:hypothetical protein Tco_0077544, partial [Tanacetum coccineum]
VDPEDGRVYADILIYAPPTALVQTPPSPEWLSGSLPVSPSSPVVPSPIALLVTTLASTISVDEDQFLEVGAQLELHGSILHNHTQRLDTLPPTLFEGYDRDLRELYTRLGAVRDEIFSQRYRFRSLEREQESVTVTFSAIWRPNHDLRVQIAKEMHERLELADHVARIKRRQESREELLGAYDLGVATPKALVHAGDKTSGDARSWYMISGDAKSWVVIVLHTFTVILHNCPVVEILAY